MELEAIIDNLFQTHIGAIRINLPLKLSTCSVSNFNPTLVQLEWKTKKYAASICLHFNPTLVQLELNKNLRLSQNLLHFNPTLVQLE